MASGTRSAKQRAAKKKRKMVIFVIEVIVILVMLVVLWRVMKTPVDGPKRVEINFEKIGISQEIQQDKETGESTMKGYMNVALFGVDATTDNQLYKGSRSDSMMIASINLDNGEIKLVSVYRDTFLNIGTDEFFEHGTDGSSGAAAAVSTPNPDDCIYLKCNAAYSYGGAERALWTLNTNLDMDIQAFVTVGYRGLSEVVDGLGGVWIDVTEAELPYLNHYQMKVAEVLKCEYTPLEHSGYQKLDGLQATGYCRIRYTDSDFKRTERQRDVLKAIEKEAKNTDLATLTKIFENCSEHIYTNITNEQIMELLSNITKYSIVDEGGFPQADDKRTVVNIDALRGREIGSIVVPTNLEENVVWLHKFLFGDEGYTVTDGVKEISNTIDTLTGPYRKK